MSHPQKDRMANIIRGCCCVGPSKPASIISVETVSVVRRIVFDD
jgi:hypothetical protein